MNPLSTLKSAAIILGATEIKKEQEHFSCVLGGKSVFFSLFRNPKYPIWGLCIEYQIEGQSVQHSTSCDYDPPIYVLVSMKEGKAVGDFDYSLVSKLKKQLIQENLYPICKVEDDKIDRELFKLGFKREETHTYYPNAFCSRNTAKDGSFSLLRVFKGYESACLSTGNPAFTFHGSYRNFVHLDMPNFSIEAVKELADKNNFRLSEPQVKPQVNEFDELFKSVVAL